MKKILKILISLFQQLRELVLYIVCSLWVCVLWVHCECVPCHILQSFLITLYLDLWPFDAHTWATFFFFFSFAAGHSEQRYSLVLCGALNSVTHQHSWPLESSRPRAVSLAWWYSGPGLHAPEHFSLLIIYYFNWAQLYHLPLLATNGSLKLYIKCQRTEAPALVLLLERRKIETWETTEAHCCHPNNKKNRCDGELFKGLVCVRWPAHWFVF